MLQADDDGVVAEDFVPILSHKFSEDLIYDTNGDGTFDKDEQFSSFYAEMYEAYMFEDYAETPYFGKDQQSGLPSFYPLMSYGKIYFIVNL